MIEAQSQTHEKKIPVTLLTGFLGAGKTTFLNFLLKDPLLKNSLVLINEIGSISLDQHFISAKEETFIELSSGCLCCTVSGEIENTIADAIAQRANENKPPFQRLIIETTGLALPIPIVQVLQNSELLQGKFEETHVVTVVDGCSVLTTLDEYPEVAAQIAVADKLVVTKLDLLRGVAGEEQMFATLAKLRAMNNAARILTTHRNEASAEKIINTRFSVPQLSQRSRRQITRSEKTQDSAQHSAHVENFTLVSEHSITPQKFALFIETLLAKYGADILRIKGFVKVTDQQQKPLSINYTQNCPYALHQEGAWPDGLKQSVLVFIGKNLKRNIIQEMFLSFCQKLSYENYDASDSTLTIPGQS